MPLNPLMMSCAVRVIGEQQKALGTAFFLRIASRSVRDKYFGYLLTAAHAVDEELNTEILIPNAAQPGEMYPKVSIEKWVQPLKELDIAIARLDPPENYDVTALDLDMHLVDDASISMVGATFYYVGWLDQLNRIMVRAGTLGAVDQTGISHEGGYRYITHLADCRSYRGFSGSPCMIEYVVPSLTEEDPKVPTPPDIGPVGRLRYLHLLCGMFTGHLEAKGTAAASLYGVGTILAGSEIRRALSASDFADERD